MDYSMDKKIWNNDIDYYIEVNDFDPNKKTQLAPGSELTVYSETTKHAVDFYFASKNGSWINYKKGE